jgi:hypothetical protein
MANRELELSTDPVTESVQELIAFFAAELDGVSFPDTDGGTLDAGALEQLADKVRRGAAEVQRARKALEEANLALAAARDELEDKAVRALGYAKVFCQGQPALADKTDTLSLGAPKKKVKKARPVAQAQAPAKKGRKKEPTPLPLNEAPAEEPVAEVKAA